MNMNNDGFLDWFESAKWRLPPEMTVKEARLLYERKVKEEKKEEWEHEKTNTEL